MPTVEVTAINGCPVLNVTQARQCLGIQSPTTFNADREVFNLQQVHHFTQADLVQLFTLRLWLQARPGVNSRESFKRFYRQPALLNLKFQQWGIHLDERIQHFKESLSL